jgi:poly(hydroxyalkanoate) depolymerase family esterase
MAGVDWRKLYAANQAAIARGRITRGHPTPASHGRLSAVLPAALAGGERVSNVGAGSRRALVHLPRDVDSTRPVPLVCMLHGCTQDPATFAAATLMNDAADRHGFVVVYPGQDRSRNAQGCWNWFLAEHQQRDSGEPAAIAAIVRDLIETNSRCSIDSARVFVAGLSSGGAMAVILAACYPDLFAAVAVHSALAYRSATSVGSAFDVMARGRGDADAQGHAAHAAMGDHARAVPSMVIHGSADQTVAPRNAIHVLRQSMTTNHLAAPDDCQHDPEHPSSSWRSQVEGEHPYTRSQWINPRGSLMHELLMIDALGHAWSGGATGGSHTDPRGPSATEAIWTFFAATPALAPAR